MAPSHLGICQEIKNTGFLKGQKGFSLYFLKGGAVDDECGKHLYRAATIFVVYHLFKSNDDYRFLL